MKSVEAPEYVIPTTVWFDHVDRFYRIVPHALYFSGTLGFVFRGILRDGEVDMTKGPGSPSSNEDEMISQVVKGASQILKNIPSDRAERSRRLLGAVYIIIDRLSCLRIALDSDSIRIGREERSDCDLQITDVLFGPFNFYADNREAFVGGHDVSDNSLTK